MSNIHKYINLESLPRYSEGKYKGCIDWKNAIGYKLYFEYDDIKDFIEITGYEYINNRPIVTVKYKDILKKVATRDVVGVYFGKILGKITNNFRFNIGDKIKDDYRELVVLDREIRKNKRGQNKKFYKYKCIKCSYDEGWIEEISLLRGTGCACCCNTPRIIVKGINDIATTDPWMIEYLVNPEDAYTHSYGESTKVEVKCPHCGRIKENKVTLNHLYTYHSIGCVCSDGVSYPEKFVWNIFEQLNESIIREYNKTNANWCNNYRYDFYSEKFNIIIETHGGQHYVNNTNFQTSLNKIQSRDELKRSLALSNNIENYIELDCKRSTKQYIKNSILNSELINYFDFDNIDWDKADVFATNNLIKTICEFYEDCKGYMTHKEIANKFNISHTTLLKYLKKGDEIGWCKFNTLRNK